VTGPPAGWCDHIARMWPWTRWWAKRRLLLFLFGRQAAQALSGRRAGPRAKARAPGRHRPAHPCRGARMRARRRSALTGDRPRDRLLRRRAAARVRRRRADCGADARCGTDAKISSIHVNGWFGGYDKLTTTRILFDERFGRDPGLAKQGVRFRRRFAKRRPDVRLLPELGRCRETCADSRAARASPKYVTGAASGAGFVELAEHLLQGQ